MKKSVVLILVLFVIFMFPQKCFAIDYQTEIENIAEEYDISREKISSFSVEEIVDYVKSEITNQRKEPVRLIMRLSGIVIICAVVKALQISPSGADSVADSICTIIVFLALLSPLENIIAIVSENLFQVKNFMTIFLPLFAGISMASGEFATSAVYSGLFLSGLVFISDLCIGIVLPSVQLYFALIISNAISPFIKLKSICDFYLKAVKWGMRSLVSVLCIALTVQTTISRGSDTLAVKAGKAIAGTAVPVIGSVLRDAMGSVYAGMEAIKGFAGAVGIIAVLYIFLPSLVILGIYWLCINILYIMCDMFGVKAIGDCVKGFENVTELLISVIVLFLILLIFSLTIMISLTNGV